MNTYKNNKLINFYKIDNEIYNLYICYIIPNATSISINK